MKRGKRNQPIAIIGMACRFPNAPNISAFWRLLEAGENAVTKGSPGSGVGRIGTLFPDAEVQNDACRFGAFVEDIDLFDAAFFRISPVEAQLLDPQQRMMLETSWQAFEDAGIDPDRLRGSRTGVYAGISNNDYRGVILGGSRTADPSASLFSVAGTSLNTAIGRVAFALGLGGPAMAVDTACSSSLVAINQAVAELQQGKADLALAGGVQAILSGRLTELRGNAGMLSPDGQCKAFDASANGFVRGEGCGIVVLKRLDEAEADGDHIWGVIRSVAVNQDGASTGLTVPNGEAQERVIEEALSRAGILPSEVDYVEAHGTGTEVGDPIEINATAAAYGKGRAADNPILVGSVKTNIGHLEPTAGIAGLIKTVLSMKRGVIPRHLHFENPNPNMDWDRLPLRVTSEATDWPLSGERPPIAGVNSFGWSGTNAHVIVAGYGSPESSDEAHFPMGLAGPARPVAISLPDSVPPPEDELAARRTRLLPLSAKSDEALRDLARQYLKRDVASGDEALLADMAWTAGVGRSQFSRRAGIVFDGGASLRERLHALAETSAIPAPQTSSRIAFVYTGQGSQWVGMGEHLYQTEPVARAVLDQCDAVLREARGASLLDAMFGRAGDLSDQAWTQPAIFAIECALTALWKSVGITPDVVLGHSLGELAAAQAAGVFSIEEGVRFAAARGELTATLPGGGAMAAIFADVAQVASALDELNAASTGVGLSIAGYNGAHQVVSGPEEKVEALSERFLAQDIRVSRLRATHAFHSALIEPMLDKLDAIVAEIAIAPPSLALVSNVTGQTLETGKLQDSAYWRRHTREPVAFARSIETLAGMGVDLVIEAGPHAVLSTMATLAWPDTATGPPVALPSLLRPSSNVSQAEADRAFTAAVATAYEAGLSVSFAGLFAGEKRRKVSLPGYPFQRERYWVEAPKRRRRSAGHPLLGERHESASGEITFETEVFPSDPSWLNDHRVFGRVIAPGAFYGAMAISASAAEGNESMVIEEMQLHSPLIFPKERTDNEEGAGREMQVLLAPPGEEPSRLVRIFSKGEGEEDWTLHAECRAPSDAGARQAAEQADMERLKAALSPEDMPAFYRAKASVGIDLGPSFRTLRMVWSGENEALGEVCFPEAPGGNDLDVHPLLLDACFQAMGAARNPGGAEDAVTYLPFGWERLWLPDRLPDRFFCHVRMREASGNREPDAETGGSPEVFVGDFLLYDQRGSLVGELSGFMVKRATRAALLSAVEGVQELLYEVAWRESPLAQGLLPADFLPRPGAVADRWELFSDYLAAEGVDAGLRPAWLADLSCMARHFALSALEKLGWERKAGDAVDSEGLRQRLGVLDEHSRLFRRMLDLLAQSGVLEAAGEDFVVVIGAEDPLPEGIPDNPEQFAAQVIERYAYASSEIGIFRRSAGALAEVLRGEEDPLSLLFGSGEPSAADLYFKAPIYRASNRMLGDAVRTLVAGLPEGRCLRVIEVGAGTGSATESVLPALPEGRYDYMYTDISAGFFAQAEALFGDERIEYRVLDIEKDPVEQGFDAHGYDLLIASNVLHATRYLEETLTHCRSLLAPSGHLVALENLCGQDWLDMTFGQLDGWWRFSDDCRPRYALAGPDVWRQSLGSVGFESVEILGLGGPDAAEMPDRGVILAQQPEAVAERRGVWVLAADRGGEAAALASELAARNQTVVLASDAGSTGEGPAETETAVIHTSLELARRESWRSLLEGLPADAPLSGVVHFAALDGHGFDATTAEMAADVKRAGASALALAQSLVDADMAPEKGLWFLTRGAQALERERAGELAGATLWGFGKVLAREAPHLQPRMIDLDPDPAAPPADLANELLYPDTEDQIVRRGNRRRVARLVRIGEGADRINLPGEPGWMLGVGEDGAVAALQAPRTALESKEVRVAVEAAGLNFWDVFAALGLIDEKFLGTEFCGHIVEVGSEAASVAVGDRVVGLAFGAFGPEVATRAELVAPAPTDLSATALASMPTVFVSVALSYELAELKAGDRALIHAGAGGVGLAAIQWAQAAGAEVFATASAPKQAYLRSLGVKHVFDSRQTKFGEEILEATGGAGVDVVLNSLTAEGFIDASLACLAEGGRFVELAARDILSEEQMAAVRPDVAYYIVNLHAMKGDDPARPGALLRDVMKRLAAGELTPLIHSRWPFAEARRAIEFMRDGRHIGKIAFANSPLASGRLRADRTYLVTGGLGGIGCVLADYLADRGAGAIALNGRRAPGAEAEETIRRLRARGVTVQVEIADVTDADAIDEMLARIDETLPPLGGVIHSVGVLSDGALGNQRWERFEQVLWPKVLGAWHLHQATADRDLDMFILFSSVAGVLGNPGQSNHAAANAFLDQLAMHRRALGLPGQTIAWGAWSELGEAEEQRERIAERLEARGTGWITPQQGLRAFDQLVREDAAASVVLAADWSSYGESLEYRMPLLEDMLSAISEDESGSPALADDLMSHLAETPAAEREALLVSFLQQELQAVLRLPTAPEPTVGFFDLGMDSLMAVALRNRLNRAFADAYAVPNTVVFDYPDIARLASHLLEALGEVSAAPMPPPQAQPEPEPQPAAQREDDGIAIVGMACRFPGAPDITAFWRLLEAGANAVTDGRQDSGSWNHSANGLPQKYAPYRRGGFVEGIDQFDAGFFRISPIEARMMDPRQRMMLETTWLALEDAGMNPDELRGSRTGLYAGVATSEYRDLMTASDYGVNYLSTAASMTVGRIAFFLGLEGPTMPVELNCASSLVAVHQAAMGLRQGEIDMALVGGTHAALSPELTQEMADLGILSREGQCKTFDAAADGFVRGEGCGMVVLKRLSEAEADGDRIWGVIRGSAVNQNGASAGPTVPNGPVQEQLIEEALSRAGVAPSEVDYLEAHGGASEFGDPIEVQAAAAVYGKGREADRPLLIGSVKTNIGHIEPAAGVAALIKAVLAMKRGKIPKHLHLENPSRHIDWNRLPVQVVSEGTDWPRRPERPPRAGISAFGISGANAHVVVEGYGSPDATPAGLPRPVSAAGMDISGEGRAFAPRQTRLLPLSGKSDEALRDLADRYLSWLDKLDNAEDQDLLADMAWTAGAGRSHFDHRAGIAFQDAASLRKKLQNLAETGQKQTLRTATKIAFVCAGEGGEWIREGKALYESEPAVRAVLDRCDQVIREERSASLLDAMFGQTGNASDLAQAAVYAMASALAALWSSAGIRPVVVVGRGAGEIAAAGAAGVFSLEDGVRIAAAQGANNLESILANVEIASPSLILVSSITGGIEVLDAAYWRRQAQEPAALAECGKKLANLNVDALLEMGPGAAPGLINPTDDNAKTLVVLPSPGNSGFAESAAKAYEAGLSVSFDGLFAGETRRRISLPGYPFQRQSYWIA